MDSNHAKAHHAIASLEATADIDTKLRITWSASTRRPPSDSYTTQVKSINSIVAKCENVLIQSPWIGKLEYTINSIMLLSTYESIQSSQKNDSNDSIKSINSTYMLTFWKTYFVDLCLENVPFCWLLWDILNQFNWFNHTSFSKSTDSVTYFMKTTSLSHNELTWKRNRINSINFPKKKNRFKSINSVESIGIQVSPRIISEKN